MCGVIKITISVDVMALEVLLNKVKRAGLRIRDFASVLQRGFLGKDAQGLYTALPVSDQALTRERYLRLVERVPQELRQRRSMRRMHSVDK